MWRRRWLRFGLLAVAAVAASAAATALAAAVNVATGGSAPWWPAVEAQPLWWMSGATAAVASAGLLMWWAQRQTDQNLSELVPVAQRPDPWVVNRPAEVSAVTTALSRRGGATVGITTAVHGAGGFGKTTVAKLVRADRRVLRRFGGRVYWVTMGRDVRAPAAIAAKVNDLIARLDPQNAVTFTDPQQASEHLAALLAAGPPRLLILDDVWYPEQEAAFPVGGRCARLITTRIRSLVAGEHVQVGVDQLTPTQARALLTAGLPPMPERLVADLVAETGQWPLLLRLVNKILADQLLTDPDASRVAEELLGRLHASGALQVDELTGAAGQPLDINDPQQRQQAVAATIAASTGLATDVEQARFAELAIFAEDETVPVDLIGRLWQATGGLDILATRALCARLDQLALLTVTTEGDSGVVSLHDVIRDFLRQELGSDRLIQLHRVLLHAAATGLPPRAGDAGAAWWELDESARYLWDHLIGHLIAAELHDAAQALATDLRWVTARLNRSGPAAPSADIAQIDTPQCIRLHRLLGQTAHLLAPTQPTHSRTDVLYSRVAHDPYWGPQVTALTRDRTALRLTNRWPLPDLPDPALRRVLAGHFGGVTPVAVAPDGTWLATSGRDGTVRIWDATTGTERAVLNSQAKDVAATVAVAPDSTWLATGDDKGTVRIWDVATGITRKVLNGHTEWVSAVAVGPDGSWLATGDYDGTVRIWDMATSTTRAVLNGHTEWVTAVAVAPDGTWLATSSADGRVRTWDVSTGTEKAVLNSRTGWATKVAVAPDSTWLATTSGHDNGTVRIWDVITGTLRTVLNGHTSWVTAVAVAPDGTWLATTGADGDSTVRLWDVATGTTRTVLNGHTSRVTTVAVAPDSTWLATGDDDGTVRIWDVATGTERAVLNCQAKGVATVEVSPDGTWLVTSDNNGTVRIWDVSSATRAVVNGRAKWVSWVEMMPDGSCLTTVGTDGTVQIWDVATGTPRTVLNGHTDWVAVVAPDNTWLATSGDDSTVLIWDVATGTPRTVLNGHTAWVTAVAVAPDSTWLATSAVDGTVRIWDVATGTTRTVLNAHASRASTVAVAPDGTWLATTGGDGAVRIWEVVTGALRTVLNGHSSGMVAIDVAPDGAWLATSDDGTVRIWDAATGTERTTLNGQIDGLQVAAVAPNGIWLATTGADGTVRVWDVATGALRTVLNSHPSRVTAVAVAPAGTYLAISGADGTLRIWDPDACRPLAVMRFEQSASACVWTPDGRSILVGGRAGLYLFDFHR